MLHPTRPLVRGPTPTPGVCLFFYLFFFTTTTTTNNNNNTIYLYSARINSIARAGALHKCTNSSQIG